MAAHRLPGFRGRTSERDILDRLLANVRGGQSAVLIIRGEAGIGKTALLRYAARQAAGFQVAQLAGVQSEMELPFAGLHQLCAPMLARLDALPDPQRSALSVALGLSSGDTPDRFMVALAVLSLLAVLAEKRPLLCLVDDAQWLDGASGQALGFVARRLLAESVGMLFSVREPSNPHELMGLPELSLEGLGDDDARALLATVMPGRLDERVRDRIVAETRGNPLALLELPRSMSAAELAGGFALPDTADLPSQIEDQYRQRVRALPESTQRLMLLAAADPVGDATLVWRAAHTLGIAPEAAQPAETEHLLEIGARAEFRHPLVRSAVYHASTAADRRAVHGALAAGTDPETDPDRRAWHRAHAASAPNDDVADELIRCASRAQTRGGLAAAAAFFEEAARLTGDPVRRAERALAAAQAKHRAGAAHDALALLAIAEAGPFDELRHARADLLRAKIAFAARRGNDAPPLLLEAAQRLEPLDRALARETYLDAFAASLIVGRLSRGADVVQVARAARAAPGPSVPQRPPDLLLDGLALLVTEGHAAAQPLLTQALNAFRSRDITVDEGLRWLWLAGRVAQNLWDDESWEVLCAEHVRLARQAGALTVLPVALRSRIFVHALCGELDEGASLTGEVRAVTDVTRTRLAPFGAVVLAAWGGREAEARELIEATLEDVMSRGEGMGVAISHYAAAVLYNGIGRYTEAVAEAEAACEYDDLGVLAWAQTELVEAAARSGRRESAAGALARLGHATRAAGTDWALGIEARSRALVSGDDAAERLYREAIDRLSRTRVRAELARAHLLYGEWLRRQNRRVDAREQLHAAYDMFASMGAEGFAGRARRELRATGEKPRKRRDDTRDELTPQEEQIARLARDGRTNPEIGAELFISPRTVEWHLRKVFTKLGISSRNGLHDALPSRDRNRAPA